MAQGGDPGLIVLGGGAAAAACRAALLAAGRAVTAVRSADDAVRRAAEAPGPLVVAVELQSSEFDGLSALTALRAAAPQALLVALARAGSLNRARAAMEAGAFDYVAYPDAEALFAPVVEGAMAAALRPPGPREEAALLAAAPSLGGSSAAAAECRRTALRLAQASAPVLLSGERGTGKGMAAAAMLAAYPRPDRPLSRLRCAPRDPEDLARELDAAQRRWRREARGDAGRADGAGGEGGREDDGREDGGSENEGREAAGRADAGTDSGGAETQSPGLGETLLLEMACTLPPGLQSRVLRLLDIAAGAGGGPGGAARLRLICSTRDDLEQRVADGQFRETLHHRLSIARLRLPPLRERGEDVIELAELRLAARAPGFRGLHPELRRALLEHPWPRNSAQLTATTVALAERLDDGWATPAGLPEDFLATRLRPRAAATGRKTARAAPGPEAPAAEPSDPSTLGARVAPLVGLTVAEVEAALVEATLARCAGSVAEASRILGISPATLYRRRARRDARIALRSGDAAAAALNAAGAGPGESSGEASPGAPDAGADADP